MTLLEMTLVILVILGLITILFIGAKAWKKGADRSANILNIRNIQQAVRGHENLNGLIQGISPLTSDKIFQTDSNLGYLKEPSPPKISGVASYTYKDIVPYYGELYVTNVAAIGSDYAPTNYGDW